MRQFVSEKGLDSNFCLTVEGKKAHYLSSVLRLAVGDMIYVRLPDSVLQPMTVAKIDSEKKTVLLQVAGDVLPSDSDKHQLLSGNHALPQTKSFPIEFWLFMFAAKPSKMDLIVRQAAECGVLHFVPVEGDFCQKSSIESAIKKSSEFDTRWSRIVTEALEQSGSSVATQVNQAMDLKSALELWKKNSTNADLALVLYEQTAKTKNLHRAVLDFAGDLKKIERCALFVGAEGGISPTEIDFLRDNNVVPIHFETNILRCETAALYGLAAIQNVLREMDVWRLKE